MKKLALLLMVMVTALPGNHALAESEATVPLVAPNEEDYPDDALDLPGSEELPVEELFGDRLGEVWIDRSASPSVLKVSVVGPTADDAAALSELSGDNPRVVLDSTPHSIRQLRKWMTSTEDVLRRHSLTAAWYEPRGREGILVVRTTTALPDATVREVLATVPGDAIKFEVGAPAELLHASRADYPPHEAALSMTLAKLSPAADPNMVRSRGVCTTGYTLRDTIGQYFGSSAGHCAAIGHEVRIGSTYVNDVNRNAFQTQNPVASDSLRYRISPTHAAARISVASNEHRIVRGKFLDADLRWGTRLCFQGVASGGNNCGNIYLVRENTTMNDPYFGSKTIQLDYCVDVPAVQGDSGGPVYQVNADASAKAAGLVSSNAKIELREIDPGSSMTRREPRPQYGFCFTSAVRLETYMNAAILQG